MTNTVLKESLYPSNHDSDKQMGFSNNDIHCMHDVVSFLMVMSKNVSLKHWGYSCTAATQPELCPVPLSSLVEGRHLIGQMSCDQQ